MILRVQTASARIKDLCQIQPGYTGHRRLAIAGPGKGVPLLSLREDAPDGLANPGDLVRVWPERPLDRYLVRAGDLVFRTRGERTTATAIDPRFREPAVALIPLFILRPDRDRVMPEYLEWAINHSVAQRHFDRVARGTGTRMILRPGLEDLQISLPSLRTQRLVVAFHNLADREFKLTLRVAERRRELASHLLEGLTKVGDTNESLPPWQYSVYFRNPDHTIR